MPAFNRIAVVPLLFVLQSTYAFADDPPRLDVAPTCAGATHYAVGAGRDNQACLEDEHAAETVVAQNWSKYNADDKAQCTGTVKTGGPASYVELLSCLEVMRDAKELREGDAHTPSEPTVQPRRRR
jgi:hypothetical protein